MGIRVKVAVDVFRLVGVFELRTVGSRVSEGVNMIVGVFVLVCRKRLSVNVADGCLGISVCVSWGTTANARAVCVL